MKIILDAMGGDLAPQAAISGALEAHKQNGTHVVLVGRTEKILEELNRQGIRDLPEGIEVKNAEDVVDMHDDPATVLHQRKNSSMVIGLKMLADGEGDAFVSAGSTGALLTGATLLVKRVRGIRRGAMSPALPTKTGKVVICDCGANAECSADFLLQFAVMASAYAKNILKIQNPRVGLLNIGAEDSKGTQLQKDAFQLLTTAKERGVLNFVGNVEARDVPLGAVDVIVCDGFAGNILLKSIEGTAMFMGSLLKRMFQKSILSKLGYLCCKAGMKEISKLMDYREIGGTQIIGIQKPVIKAHGSSDALAFRNAIAQAVFAAENDFSTQLPAALAALKESSHD